MKCPLLQKSIIPNEDGEPRQTQSYNQQNSMNRLYNKFKPAGFRKFVSHNKSYSDMAKNNNNNNSRPPPPPKEKNTVDDSIHNPNNEINKKLDQILSILSNLKKDMNELDARIVKLEAYQHSSNNNTLLPPPVIPMKNNISITQDKPPTSPPLILSKDTPNKRT